MSSVCIGSHILSYKKLKLSLQSIYFSGSKIFKAAESDITSNGYHYFVEYFVYGLENSLHVLKYFSYKIIL